MDLRETMWMCVEDFTSLIKKVRGRYYIWFKEEAKEAQIYIEWKDWWNEFTNRQKLAFSIKRKGSQPKSHFLFVDNNYFSGCKTTPLGSDINISEYYAMDDAKSSTEAQYFP